MKTLKINEPIEISELLKRRKTDNNKYVFEYYQDIAWDDLDENTKNLNKYYEENNTEKFIELYNKLYSSKIFSIHHISNMAGPGGGWPDATIYTEFVTIDEFIKLYEEENEISFSDCDELTIYVVKVQE